MPRLTCPYPLRLARLDAIASQVELGCDFRPYKARKRSGWRDASAKPYCLFWRDGGSLVASFATLDGLEKSVRARAGC